MHRFVLLLGLLLMQLSIGQAVAQEAAHYKELHLTPSYCSAPCVDYELSNELENDWTFAADPSSLTSNSLYPTLEALLAVSPVDQVRFIGGFIYEPVSDATPGRNQAFTDLGLYADLLYTQFEARPFDLRAGKVHPSFGRAWDVTPGLHAQDIPGNYELEERIGVAAAYAVDAWGLEHVLQASAFTTDRTVLSESAFTHRPRTRLSDGGAGNTNGVSSFSVTLDGCMDASALNCYSEGGFGYQLAARYQRKGRSVTDEDGNPIKAYDESGFAGSINKAISIGDKTLRLFCEAAYFRHFEGEQDDALFLTASSELDIDSMSYSLAYTSQQDPNSDARKLFVDLAVYYDLSDYLSIAGEEWTIGAGYTLEQNGADHTTAHLLSVQITIDLNGSFP
ncbi:hypothetical protein [Hypericibacter sp.]|uniref:hypothetical protein n=1 Tax=Hypericibacter sp. TaxID=2705401 RepID=UPI003D6D2131